MTKHTPGPWTVHGSDNATPHVMRAGALDIRDLDKLICAMPAEISQSFNSWANARLIAAAPELLAALELAKRVLPEDALAICPDANDTITGIGDIIDDAILKATGEKV